MAYKIDKKRKQFVEEFEYMRNKAELNAIMKVSLERPLTDREYNRAMELKKKVIG
jgi:hypothetical protein